MDTETKEKLTELQHQQELLTEKVEGNMKIMRAENDSALSRNEAAIAGLRTDFEKLRTTIEGNSRTLLFQMIAAVAAVAGITGLLIKVFGS